MATYSGALTSEGLPELAELGEIDFPAMTPRRALHVALRNPDGTELRLGQDPAPGSAPDNPLYVANPDGQNLRVVVEGVPNIRQATAEVRQAAIVSTTAVRLAGDNVSRVALLVQNFGTGMLYLGNTSSVTSSGATAGTAVGPGGFYSDSGEGVSIGALWGIYGAASTVHNVSVVDRS